MLELSQVKKAIGPIKFLFWIQVVLFVSVVYSHLRDLVLESYLGGSFGFDIIGAILILYISLLLAVRLRGHARISLLYLVAVIEALRLIDFISRLPYALGNKEITQFILVLWYIIGFVRLIDMFFLSLFALWLCRDANLLDAARQWKRTLYAFLFIYIIPNVIYTLLVQFIMYRNPRREMLLNSPLFLLGVTLLFIIPLLLFHNSIKAMTSSTALTDSSKT